MSRPWFPFYVGDYMRDTARLTTEAHGAYLLLMLDYWVHGAPPDDDEVLATITKLAPNVWKKRRASLAQFFDIKGGKWTHKRIEKELETAASVGKSNSEKAREAALKRWEMERLAKSLADAGHCSEDAPSNACGDAPSISQAVPQNAQPQAPSPSESKTRVFFDEFWSAYPRRDEDEQRDRAEQVFAQMVDGGVDPKVIIFVAKAYCAKTRKQNAYATRFVKVAWRWLGGQDFSGAVAAPSTGAQFAPAENDWRSAVKRWLLNESNWPRWAGNTPGSPSCRCPPEILAEMGVCPNTARRIDESWHFAVVDTLELTANLDFAERHKLKIRLYKIMDGGVEREGAYFMKRFPPGYDEATGERLAPANEENAA